MNEMMNETTNTTTNMRKIFNNSKTGTYILSTANEDEFHEFEFYTDLSVANKLYFVNSVTDLVVDENRYNSVIRDLVFDFYIIDIMTNIDTTELKKSISFINAVEEFLLSTNIVEIVKANMSPSLLDELNKAVDKSIAYRTGIHSSPISDAIASLLSALEKRINEVDMSSMMEMAKKLSGITGELNADSIVNAYINSDMHKKNLDEIAKVKAKTDKKNSKNSKNSKDE